MRREVRLAITMPWSALYGGGGSLGGSRAPVRSQHASGQIIDLSVGHRRTGSSITGCPRWTSRRPRYICSGEPHRAPGGLGTRSGVEPSNFEKTRKKPRVQYKMRTGHGMKGVVLQVIYVDSTSVCGRSIIRGGRLSAGPARRGPGAVYRGVELTREPSTRPASGHATAAAGQ